MITSEERIKRAMSIHFDPDEQDVEMAMSLHRRHISEEQMRKFEDEQRFWVEAARLSKYEPQ